MRAEHPRVKRKQGLWKEEYGLYMFWLVIHFIRGRPQCCTGRSTGRFYWLRERFPIRWINECCSRWGHCMNITFRTLFIKFSWNVSSVCQMVHFQSCCKKGCHLRYTSPQYINQHATSRTVIARFSFYINYVRLGHLFFVGEPRKTVIYSEMIWQFFHFESGYKKSPSCSSFRVSLNM